jgi:uncharacterized protein YndB with AHSA1/START domain
MPRTFQISVEIQATPAVVWGVMTDLERCHQWTPTVTSIQRRESGPLAVGSRAHIRQPALPPADWQVIALDPGSSFTWLTKAPGVRVLAKHWVEPSGSGTRATLSHAFEGVLATPVAWITSGINERYLGLEPAGLKTRCEAR